MSTARGSRRAMVAAVAAALLALSASGCSGGEQTADGCDELELRGPDTSTASYLFLLDTDDNSPAAAARVAADLRPYVERALDEEARLRVVIDAGTGRPLADVACLDGSRAISLERNNERREQADRAATQQDITDRLHAAVRNAEVQSHGTSSRLLRIAADVDDAAATTIVLWSSLLGVSADHTDCMDTDGLTAAPPVAASVVARCLSSGQLQTIPAEQFVVLGVGSSAVTVPQDLLASLLAGELCRQITSTTCGDERP